MGQFHESMVFIVTLKKGYILMKTQAKLYWPVHEIRVFIAL